MYLKEIGQDPPIPASFWHPFLFLNTCQPAFSFWSPSLLSLGHQALHSDVSQTQSDWRNKRAVLGHQKPFCCHLQGLLPGLMAEVPYHQEGFILRINLLWALPKKTAMVGGSDLLEGEERGIFVRPTIIHFCFPIFYSSV